MTSIHFTGGMLNVNGAYTAVTNVWSASDQIGFFYRNQETDCWMLRIAHAPKGFVVELTLEQVKEIYDKFTTYIKQTAKDAGKVEV